LAAILAYDGNILYPLFFSFRLHLKGWNDGFLDSVWI
jgi:hypothetical protein